jgi:amino acid adenylation domain-containing protein
VLNKIMSAADTITAFNHSSKGLPEPLRQLAGQHAPYPPEKTVAQLFEEAVKIYADRVAVICGGARLTYRELNQRANAVALRLQELGVKPESLVGLCLERSAELIVGLLGILKAGGAYVPLDPEYPRERINFMLGDTSTSVMLTQLTIAPSVLADSPAERVYLDDLLADGSLLTDKNPELHAGPDSLAYVLYTSGSTGRPKGVLVENRSIVRLVFNTNFCQFGPEEVFLHFAPISFDASTFEIWGALLHGSTLVVMPPKASSLPQIGQVIRDHKVTTAWLTAGLFHLFVDECLEDLRPLKQLLAGGDVLSAAHVRQVLTKFPHITLINGYGPTEGTTFTCCHVMRNGDSVPDSVPIGRPITNTFAYVLDENQNPVPKGQAGELYAGGDGVARGYLNAPELTAERFLPDPFNELPQARMYRTGDRVCWGEDGTLEFLGRVDTQVKILGNRIELGEIEAALLRHPAIRQACVIARADEAGNKRLMAHYVTADSQPLRARELKDFLSIKLPAFMVPALYTPLATLPLNPNGKVDRAALPTAATAKAQETRPGMTSNLEQTVTDVWKKVLHLDSLGMDENFFDLGGDSLLIVAVHSQLQKLLHREIEVTDLFEHTTIRTLSQHLGKADSVAPAFSAAQLQAQKQREAFAKQRILKGGTA